VYLFGFIGMTPQVCFPCTFLIWQVLMTLQVCFPCTFPCTFPVRLPCISPAPAQLFINYKLKSVAHLPWRVLAYKAFNTFVDGGHLYIWRRAHLHMA